jgi:nicotinate-nucleotide adenylyltransferase
MERIGLLGGTFDPPHIGHLWLAEAARQTLNLHKILFLPAGQPPHKTEEPVTAVQHRRRMAELAVIGNAHLHLDMTDTQRPFPHYTSTLLPIIHGANPDAELFLLLGSDSLRDLPFWHEPETVINQCRLAVLPRPGITVDWVMLSQYVPGVDEIVDMLDGPTIDISSTMIREWLAKGNQPHYLIPSAVLSYIQENNLYD